MMRIPGVTIRYWGSVRGDAGSCWLTQSFRADSDSRVPPVRLKSPENSFLPQKLRKKGAYLEEQEKRRMLY
ncbi:hypothetical protein AVEN_270701-1 [Araneus ventricosus]|uniref:Uncharacterized protein n=1 Tax=Araneus ventricosus TaxID=182803 RepID=A0A4Y2FG85_ARAVE|nr:hypothetical protein AVEN_270701-1 [Araneus ventricosus]